MEILGKIMWCFNYYILLQTLYSGPTSCDIILEPNPFADDFQCMLNEKKGGVIITENICYGW